MSYDIALYRIETKANEEKSKDDNFFEMTSNLVAFSQEQFQALKNRLLRYDYKLVKEDDFGLHFNHAEDDFGTALLSQNALYFAVSYNEDAIFEVGMTASEFTDTGEFAKYDFQNGAWEI